MKKLVRESLLETLDDDMQLPEPTEELTEFGDYEEQKAQWGARQPDMGKDMSKTDLMADERLEDLSQIIARAYSRREEREERRHMMHKQEQIRPPISKKR